MALIELILVACEAALALANVKYPVNVGSIEIYAATCVLPYEPATVDNMFTPLANTNVLAKITLAPVMLPDVAPAVIILPALILPVAVSKYAAVLALAVVTILVICVCCEAALALA